MKKRCFALLLAVLSAILLTACRSSADSGGEKGRSVRPKSEDVAQNTENKEGAGDEQMQEMIIDAGGQSFRAVLYDNETARALTERLPMTLPMEELHGNEKFYYLEEGLPTEAENVGSIQTGNIMLFGSDCLVLFYDGFDTSYSYTRIGQIEDAQGLAEALGNSTVEVAFRAGE